jgi:hypothetical protein
VFQRAYPVEVGLLAGLDVPQLAIPERYAVDGDGRIVTTTQRAVDGPTLADLLGSRPRGLGAETTALIALDLLTGLSALHKLGVAHRGCHADHVAVTAAGLCVLLDPGLAERTEGEPLEAACAADLAGVGGIIELCFARRHEAAPPFLARLLECRTDPAVARRGSATGLLTSLGAEAEAAFAGDWAARARERLAAAISQGPASEPPAAHGPARPAPEHRAPRTRPVGRYAAAVLVVAVVAVATQHIVAGSTPSAAPERDGSGPTAAQLVGQTGQSAQSASAAATAPPASPLPSQGSSTATTAVPPPSSASAPAPSTAPSSAPSSQSPASSGTTVTALSISSFSYDGVEPTQAEAVVTVQTSGPGPVTVALTFSGSDTSGQAGSNAPLTDRFALSGKTSYTVTDTTYGAQFCYTPYWGVTVVSTPEAPASEYAQLTSPSCG